MACFIVKKLFSNLTTERAFPKLIVYDDPIITKFPNVLHTIRSGGDLVLKGFNLNLAANLRDVRVTVDGKSCNVTALATTTLTCLLSDNLSDDEMDVIIYVGNKM